MDGRKKDKEVKNGDANHDQPRGPREKYDGPVDVLIGDYYKGLVREKETLDPQQYPNVIKLIERELSTLSSTSGDNSNHVHPTVDLYNDPPITLTVKCFPPTKAFPKFNYAGRIIGPKGAYLKAIMRETMTKMVLLGQGVMKDKEKEQDLLQGRDPKYYHLSEEMHVAITVTGPASEAYSKLAFAIDCLKRQVVSDNKELLSLPWIVRVIQNGEGPPQAYMNQGPSPPGPSPSAMRHHESRRDMPGSSPPRRPRPPPPSGGYSLLPPPRDNYGNSSSGYYESHSPSDQVYRRYTRDPTPPPRELYYDEPSSHRRPSSGRSPRSEYMGKPRGSGRSEHPRGIRGSPPPAGYYDYPSNPTPDPYYSHSSSGDARGGSWGSGGGGYPSPSSKPSKGYSSAAPRYHPYQK